MSLAETAQKLETAAKKKEYDYCVQYYPELKEKLVSLHGRLSLFFPDVKEDTVKNPGDAAYLQAHIAKALLAIDEFDSDTGKAAIESLLGYDFGDETNLFLENTLAAFKNFDFESALKNLESIKG
jgi:hypothetical protein